MCVCVCVCVHVRARARVFQVLCVNTCVRARGLVEVPVEQIEQMLIVGRFDHLENPRPRLGDSQQSRERSENKEIETYAKCSLHEVSLLCLLNRIVRV